jgi:hypothetical protein
LEKLREDRVAAATIDRMEIERLNGLLHAAQRMPAVSEYDRANGERVAELESIVSAASHRERNELARTSHPIVHRKIAELNCRLLELSNAAGECREKLTPKTRQIVEDSDWGRKLAGTEVMDRDYWQRQLDSANATIDSVAAGENVGDEILSQAKRMKWQASSNIATMDNADARWREIERERSEVYAEIEKWQAELYNWKSFDVTLD